MKRQRTTDIHYRHLHTSLQYLRQRLRNKDVNDNNVDNKYQDEEGLNVNASFTEAYQRGDIRALHQHDEPTSMSRSNTRFSTMSSQMPERLALGGKRALGSRATGKTFFHLPSSSRRMFSYLSKSIDSWNCPLHQWRGWRWDGCSLGQIPSAKSQQRHREYHRQQQMPRRHKAPCERGSRKFSWSGRSQRK